MEHIESVSDIEWTVLGQAFFIHGLRVDIAGRGHEQHVRGSLLKRKKRGYPHNQDNFNKVWYRPNNIT